MHEYNCRLMEVVLKGLYWKVCLIYLDDLIAIGRTLEDELKRTKKVFEQLACAGQIIIQKRVLYLGHVVTEEGIYRPMKGRTRSRMAHSRTTGYPLYKLKEAN